MDLHTPPIFEYLHFVPPRLLPSMAALRSRWHSPASKLMSSASFVGGTDVCLVPTAFTLSTDLGVRKSLCKQRPCDPDPDEDDGGNKEDYVLLSCDRFSEGNIVL